jgi:hypothetical protein
VVTALTTAVAVHNLAHFGALHNAASSNNQLFVLKEILIKNGRRKHAITQCFQDLQEALNHCL